MSFQHVIRKFKSTPTLKMSPSIQILRIEPLKPASTPTFPCHVPSIPLFLKHNDPMLRDKWYEQEINDLINLINVMLDNSL
jgi:hypothetical protein